MKTRPPETARTSNSKRRRWLRFGTHTLLLAVFFAAVVSAWIARQMQEARNRAALVAELDTTQVYVWQYEPTPLGCCVRMLPTSLQNWIQMRLGDSLLSGPSAISAHHLREEQVPFLLERLRQFPTLRTVSLGRGQLAEEDVHRIQKALPNVEVDVNPSMGVLAGTEP